MNADYTRILYDHYYWSRDRMLAAMEGMTTDEYAAHNDFNNYGSLRGIFTHTLASERIWLARWRDLPVEEIPGPLTEDDVPDIASLTAQWQEQEQTMREFLAGLTDAAVQADFAVKRRGGGEAIFPMWLMLTQVAQHGIQHRSEAAETLTMMGRSPGEVDLMRYWAQRA